MSLGAGEPSKHFRSQLQLEFVSVTKDNYEHGKLRQLPAVRRHIMRHVMLERTRRERFAATKEFQQKQGQSQSWGSTENVGSSIPSVSESSGKDQRQEEKTAVKEEEHCDPVKLELVKQHPATWKLDPFGSFADRLDSHTQAGLEYCKCPICPFMSNATKVCG